MRPLAPSASPPGFMSSYWTNDEIILSLDQFNRGSPIPDDVIVDNPYQYDPSNFPDGAWFLSRITEEKETKHGLWRAKGSACEIFANSAIIGWRTTFEFYQLQAPIEQKTVWMMQEYKITPKVQHDQTKSQEISTTIFPLFQSLIIYRFSLFKHAGELMVWFDILQESALCRVFSCCNETKSEHKNKINNEKNLEKNNDLDTLELLSLMAPVNPPHPSNNNEQRSIGEPLVNSQTEVVGSSLVDKSRDYSDAELDCIARGDYLEMNDLADAASHSSSSEKAELDCIARGDYLELNDLADAASHSSSSENSSRLSFASDECFDSLALLRDLDDEKSEHLNGNGSTDNYNIKMCVFQPAPLESLVKGSEAAAKETHQAPDNKKSKSHSEPSPDQAAKRLKAERRDEGPSHSCRATTSASSSSSNEPGRVATKEEKRTKKLMKYLCFMPF